MSLTKPGDCYNGFTLNRVVELPEINCLLKEIEHNPTGTQVMYIQNDDPENVFCLSLRTIPDNSNGVAHILEHTVLCGSKKFPVKDPFFAMTRRSLNTFMNAFTGADFTCYPAASQIPKDFYNLLEVYLDAVFKPNLKELSFLQEGHRLEFEKMDDPTTPLEFKGIVYNEMKGALSSPDSRLHEALDHAIYPDITYGINSGGDPKNIPELTYQQLKEFHETYYHPSRCLFYFYGNLPIEGHLDFIQENILNDVSKKEPIAPLPKQPRFSAPKANETGYPFAEDEDPAQKAMIAMGWLTCDILNQEELLALSVICIVLLSTDASPLKHALLKSGLCKQVFAGISDENSEVPFTITLRGCDAENGEALEKLIFDQLREIVKTGLPENLVESAIHQIEFHRSEITGDSWPYGLSLFMRAGLLKQHGGLPESGLLVHSLCDSLLKKMKKDPQYLTSLTKRYFLDNPHFVRVVAKPDPSLTKAENEEERVLLEKIKSKLTSTKAEQIIEEAKTLEQFQKEQEGADLNILPKVTLDDVPKEARNYALSKETVGNLTTFHHDCFTNDILYTDLIFPLPYLSEEELPYLRLFTLLFTQLGCGGRSYTENLEYIQAYTGGVAACETLNVQVNDSNHLDPYLVIQGKALHRNKKKLFQLLIDLVTSVDFTNLTRIKEVLTKQLTGIQSTLNQNALRYAMSLASSGMGPASRINQALGGLEYYHFLETLISNFDSQSAQLVQKLQELQNRLLCLEGAHLVLSCDQKQYNDLRQNNFYGLAELAQKPYKLWSNHFTLPVIEPQGRIIASPVAFSCKVMKSLPYIHPETAAISAAAKLFDNLSLHPLIREQGGAYGGGATNNATLANFTFYAYRDPNIFSSFSAFETALEKVVQKDFTASDLEEAKLEIIQGLDSPMSPGSRGYVAYSWLRNGKTHTVRQAYRDHLLALTPEMVAKAVHSELKPQFDQGVSVVFTGKELLEEENKLFKLKNKPILAIKSI